MRRVLRFVSGLLVLVLTVTSCLTTALAEPGSGVPTPFADVFGTDYASSVGPLYALGIVGGMSAHEFGVNQPVTRAQMAAFLVRAALAKGDTGGGDTGFSDVPSNYWAADAIRRAANMSYVSGYQGKFRPDDQVLEPEAITMMLRALGYGSASLDYPVGYVLKARAVGLLTDSIPFSLNETATRGWVAKVLAQMVFVVPEASTNLTLSQTRFKVAQSLTIAPAADYLLPGTTNLQALGVDWYGKSFTVDASWQVDSGPATVSTDGTLNVTDTGVVRVSATANGVSASKAYDVLQKLVPQAASLTVQPGNTATVSVDGVTAGGKHYTVQPNYIVVKGPFTVSSTGVVQATGTGTGVVRASLGSLTADINIVTATGVSISPATLTLAPGQQQPLQVFLPGSTTPLDSSMITWSVQGGGSISPSGLYTAAGATTSPVITAQVGSLTATVPVSVVTRLQVTPTNPILVSGQDLTFQVQGVTTDGKAVPVPAPSCQLDTTVAILGAGCHLAASAPGQGTLTISSGSLTTTTSVTVTGNATRIAVTPDKLSVPANNRTPVVLTVTLQDDGGRTVPQGNNTVNVTISPANLGTLDATQVTLVNGKATVTFTPGNQAGQITVFATDLTGALLSGVSTFNTYAPAATKVNLSVGSGTLQAAANSQVTITATLVDSDNAPIANNTGTYLQVSLGTSGDNVATLANNTIYIQPGQSSGTAILTSSGLAGALTINGSSSYPVVTTKATFVAAGPAAKLKIRSGYGTATANNTDAVTVYVEEQDTNGVVRTADAGVAITGGLACGSGTAQTFSGALVAGVATFSLRSFVAGDCTFTVSSSGLPVVADKATVTFKPGPATQLLLSVSPTNVVPADQSTPVQLVATVADVNGNTVTAGSYSVAFNRVSGNGTIPPANMTVTTVKGVAQIPILGSGNATTDAYTATTSGLSTTGTSGASVSISSRIVWYPSAVVIQNVSTTSANAGDTVTVTVAIKDANNYLRVQDNSTVVSLVPNRPSAIITPAQQAVTNGVATFTVRDTKVGTLTLTATSGSLATAAAQIIYAPGPLTHVSLSADSAQLAADGHSQATIQVAATDDYGNPLNTYFNLPLGMSPALGTLSGTSLSNNGSVVFTAGTTPGTVTISSSSSQYAVSPLVLTLGNPGIPSRLAIDAPTTVGASNIPSVLKVRVYDSNGNQMSLTSGQDLSQIGLQVQGSSGQNTITLSNNGSGTLPSYGYVADGLTRGAMPAVNGVAAFNFTDTKAESLTLVPVGYYQGHALQGQPTTLQVTAGTITALTVSQTPVSYNADSATNVSFGVSLTDIYGNAATSTNPDTITVSLSNTNQFTAPAVTTYTTTTGSVNVTLPVRLGVYGSTSATITSSRTGLTQTVAIVGDRAPVAPTVFAMDDSGTSFTIASYRLGAKVTITPTARLLNQHIVTMVNGQVVTLYTDTTFTTVLDTISANSAGLVVGYIKRSDLGGLGQKNIQVMLQTSLGIGPSSVPSYVTVTQ